MVRKIFWVIFNGFAIIGYLLCGSRVLPLIYNNIGVGGINIMDVVLVSIMFLIAVFVLIFTFNRND